MLNRLNQLLDVISDYLAHRKGLIPLIAVVIIVINGVLQFLPGMGLLGESNLLLHIGVILAIFGFMLAWAL